jgi:hypothetical protein
MTTTDKPEFLLPCPCCGSQAFILLSDFIQIVCTNCCLCTRIHSHEYKQEIIDIWNTRTDVFKISLNSEKPC